VVVPAAAPPVSPAELIAILRALETITEQVRSLQDGQERILEMLRRPAATASAGMSAAEATEVDALSPAIIRAGHRKSVLLVDDDPQTREAAIAALQQADVPVRACDEGGAALAAMAEEKPDVIVLELALGGEMAGKDVINMIKATMEWVDVPVLLWTREPVTNQREARLIHGADEIVPKSQGPQALVARVIGVFRRG
jgi:CheY-like chemotaxis protein